MDIKLLHFVLVVLVAIVADMMLSTIDHRLEALVENLHDNDDVPDVWSHHHPVMGSM